MSASSTTTVSKGRRPAFRRLALLRSIPGRVIALTALASYLSQAFALFLGWPAWAVVLATLLPWLPVLSREVVWTHRHYHWLALLYVLAITQVGHVLEHLVQMVQIHVLHLTGPDARGVFGALDIEWVHFLWNTWIAVAVLLLLKPFRKNPWLLTTAIIAIWHEIEHSYMMVQYLSAGITGHPGFLAKGGLIAGGLPLPRPDLHFFYNLIETIPLVAAFIYQLKRSHNVVVAKALSSLPEPVLIEASATLRPKRFRRGEVIVSEGDLLDTVHIISSGEAEAVRKGPSGDVVVTTLRPGDICGESAMVARTALTETIRAKTSLEVLSIERKWVDDALPPDGPLSNQAVSP